MIFLRVIGAFVFMGKGIPGAGVWCGAEACERREAGGKCLSMKRRKFPAGIPLCLRRQPHPPLRGTW